MKKGVFLLLFIFSLYGCKEKPESNLEVPSSEVMGETAISSSNAESIEKTYDFSVSRWKRSNSSYEHYFCDVTSNLDPDGIVIYSFENSEEAYCAPIVNKKGTIELYGSVDNIEVKLQGFIPFNKGIKSHFAINNYTQEKKDYGSSEQTSYFIKFQISNELEKYAMIILNLEPNLDEDAWSAIKVSSGLKEDYSFGIYLNQHDEEIPLMVQVSSGIYINTSELKNYEMSVFDTFDSIDYGYCERAQVTVPTDINKLLIFEVTREIEGALDSYYIEVPVINGEGYIIRPFLNDQSKSVSHSYRLLGFSDIALLSEAKVYYEENVVNDSIGQYCEVNGCYNQGTEKVLGFSGEAEYYCYKHYKEMESQYESMFGN